MKIALAVIFALSTALVFAETPGTNSLPEIPAADCGTFFLHMEIGESGKMENFFPAKPFGRIEARQIMLSNSNLLKVTSVKEGEMVSRFAPSPQKVLRVSFANTDYIWGITEMPDSSLTILQTTVDWDPKKMHGPMFVINRSETNQPAPPMPLRKPPAVRNQP